MDRMKSLVNTSLWRFIACTVVVLLLTTPLFYILTERFYAEDIIDLLQSIQKGLPIPPLDMKKDIMLGIMLQFTLIFIVLSISFIITLKFVTKHIWRPFYDTLRKTKRFNVEQNKIPHFAETHINEFKQLNEALTQVMNKNMESYNIQREFTENASHELQTPIAVFQSKLDLLLQEDLTQKQTQLVSELYAVSDRLNKLNKNLLLLAKIENHQYNLMEPVDLHTLIKKNISLYRDLYNNHSIKLIDQEHLIIKANYSLLESLFNNLLTNAARHSPNDGKIYIYLQEHTLTVSNDSNGEVLDASRLFERFNGSHSKSKGNGLGLAIVKAICDYHKWNISYSYMNGKHHFTVVFR